MADGIGDEGEGVTVRDALYLIGCGFLIIGAVFWIVASTLKATT